jgi:hypothetical protein
MSAESEVEESEEEDDFFTNMRSQELAAFKKALQFYRPSAWGKLQNIADTMYHSFIPKSSFSGTEIVNVIFEECIQRKEFHLLDAILLTYPTVQLTASQSNLKDITLFNKELNEYAPSREISSQEIATKISQLAPKSFSSDDIARSIFEECIRRRSFQLLEAISLISPTFKLTPFDTIRKAIVEDRPTFLEEGHQLTNHSLQEMFKKNGLTDESEITACYDLAYLTRHPYLYRYSSTPIETHEYSLDFLWTNLNPQDRLKDTAENIFKDGLDSYENDERLKNPQMLRALEEKEKSDEKSEYREKELEDWRGLKKTFTYKITKWADLHPGAQINLWYDSALVTQKAQQKTFEMMKNISQSRGVNLQLRDVRQLPSIKGEIEHSLHPGTPVYYRVDLLKALIADHMISSPEETAKYCVVSDIDIEPMSKEQIFDQRTLDFLSSQGYVFNRYSAAVNLENSFFIFNKMKEGLKDIHRKTVINATAENISTQRQYPLNAPFNVNRMDTLDSQHVYHRYQDFRSKIKEIQSEFTMPRKVVKCPESQFNLSGHSSPSSSHQSERFRFVGQENVPYTVGGRNYHPKNLEGQIEALKNWKIEPLPLP